MKAVFSLIILFLVFLGIGTAQVTEYEHPVSEELYEIVVKHEKAIQSEIDNLETHDWAGLYLIGDHHPAIMRISPQNRFVVSFAPHGGFPSTVNFGRTAFSNGRLSVYPEFDEDHENAYKLPTEFLVIKWGGYRHLVPPTKLQNFAYDAHSRSGNAFVDYFTNRRAVEAEPKGSPDLPREYSKYLHMKPILARVLSAKKVGDYSADAVVINAGRKKGVVEGMSFYLQGYTSRHIILRVTAVSENRAECEIYGIGGSRIPDNFWAKPRQVFSSRVPKNYGR